MRAVNGLKQITYLNELRLLAKADPRYAQLAMKAASNLGQPCGSFEVAMRSLNTCADETDEDGVVGEINFVRDLVK